MRTMKKRGLLGLPCLTAVLTVIASAAQAASITFDAVIGTDGAQDGSGVWTANAADTNWWDGAANVAWNGAAPDSAVFGAGSGAAGTVTLGESLTVGNLRFDVPGSGSYTVEGNGNALNFGSADTLITVAAGVTGTVSAASASDTRDLDISLGGSDSSLILGGTTMAFDSIDVLSAGTVTITSGATVTTDGTSNSGTQDFGFRIGAAGRVTVEGSLNLSGAMGTPSTANGGVINVNPGGAAVVSGVTLGWNGNTTLNMNGGSMTVIGTLYHMDGGAAALNLNGGVLEAGTVRSDTGNGSFQVNFNGGTLRARGNTLFTEATDKDEVAMLRVLDGGAVIDSSNKTVEAVQPFMRVGSGGLTKLGSGAMTFSGGTYTGATTVADGTLNLSFNKRATAVASGAVRDYYDRTSRLVLNGGNIAVTGRAEAPAVTRSFTVGGSAVNSGCARGGNTSGLVAGMTVSGTYIPAGTYVAMIKDGARLILSKAATNATAASVSLTFGAVSDETWQTIDDVELQQRAAITVNTNAGPGTTLLIGTISGSGSLTKDGSGTLMLAGANTYSGDTLVSNGIAWLMPQTATVTVPNPSFETHGTLTSGTWGYTPSGATWTFVASGISAANNIWVAAGAAIDGTYAAFIQNAGTITQPLTVADTGYYLLTFTAANRPNYAASGVLVKIDGVTVASFGHGVFESGAVFQTFTALVHINAGARTLTFAGVPVPPDSGTAIDAVSLAGLGGSLVTNTSVSISAGAKLDLGGNIQSVSRLYLDGRECYRGTYGTPGSGADQIDADYFVGTGMLEVLDGPRRCTLIQIK